MAVDRSDVSFTVGANIDPTKLSFAELEQMAAQSGQAVEGSLGASEGAANGLSEALKAVGANLNAVFKEVGAQLTADINASFEETTAKAKIAGLAIGAAFAVVGLGAVYTVIKTVTAAAGFMAGLITGSSYQTDGIDKLKASVAEIERLRNQMNLTREQATGMALAFDQAGTSVDAYLGTSQSLFASLINNKEALEALGINTQRTGDDVADFERIGGQAVKMLGEYRIGADRTAAANAAGLPSYEALSAALKTNSQDFAKARADAALYGLMISDDVAKATEQYNKALQEFNSNMAMTWKGVSRAVTDSLMPVLTDLADFFKEGLPVAANFTRGVMASMVSLFHGFVLSIKIVIEAALFSIRLLTVSIASVAEAFSKVIRGDFAGAWDALKIGADEAARHLSNGYEKIVVDAQKVSDRLRMAFLGGQEGEVQTASTGTGKKAFVPKGKEEKKQEIKEPAEVSKMTEYQTVLEQRRLAYERENQMREFNKSQELAYWQEILATADVSEKDRLAILLKTAKLEVEIARNAAKQQGEITALRNEDRAKAELDHIGQLQAIAQQEKDLGLISQQELLAQQKEFNNQRMAAELELLTQKLELAKLDPDKNLVLIEQLEIQKLEIMRKYAGLNAQVARDMQAEAMQPMKNIIDTMANAVTTLGRTLLGDWKNISKNLKKIFADIGISIIEETITKPLKAKFAAWLAEKIFGKAKTIGRMGELAAEAGAGGVASMAAAPFPLNFGAPAFGAAMSAAALAFAPMASAAGGFDIPAGINPIVQAHAREMILPEKQADVIRDMADGGGGAGGAMHVTIHAVDAQSIERMLVGNPQAFAAAMKQATRRGFVT